MMNHKARDLGYGGRTQRLNRRAKDVEDPSSLVGFGAGVAGALEEMAAGFRRADTRAALRGRLRPTRGTARLKILHRLPTPRA